MKIKKFVIVSPKSNSGGAIVLRKLCKLLSEKGYDARMYYLKGYTFNELHDIINITDSFLKDIYHYLKEVILPEKFPSKFTKPTVIKEDKYLCINDCHIKFLPFVSSNTIVVYPETIKDNFLKAKHVIRYCLYYPDLKENNYGKNDVFIYYRDYFNNLKKINDYTVYINHYDTQLFRQTNFNKRVGKCFIIRKGSNRNDLPSGFDGVIIDQLSEYKKAKIFNECKYCYLYDTQSGYALLAALCGCIPIVVPEKNKTRKDYLAEDETDYGIAYGDSKAEIEYAINTRDKLVNEVNETEINNQKEILKFIDICKKEFK